ncbi:Na+/H+ antiporter subunit E [Geodermatophilus sp. TF02-6]|uniref:Na+/H+ antiporter subunit E n=1 Tax=Geodermatophilus sp. TF02-6 TaxID=2250575 RepID=UPI000DEA7E37|nr:Na+/H+ antiporter subunit E [Geodermatophilus sp. TF02-6]RBY78304.1 Na+/H+ antiporter subunit E [Geodermatophilus sp. TF02-6]
MSTEARRDWIRHDLPLLVWLVVVWILLWGDWSWANLIGGVLVALAVTWLLPLPPAPGGLRFRAGPFVVLLGRFVRDLVVSSVEVAWVAFRPGPPPRGAVISVQLRTDSDLLLTIVAEMLCLVPGSIVIDLDREHLQIALHVLSVRDMDEVREQEARVLAQEERVVRAFGSSDDVAALDRVPVQTGGRR